MKKVMFCAATAVLAAVVCFAPAQADEAKGAKHGAAIGAEAPNFTLTDTDGTSHTLADLKGKVVVLEWFNPTCPYVVKHHEKNPTMKTLYAKYKDQNVVWMAINSGAEGKPGSSAEENVAAREKWGIEYPVLLDSDGSVGHAYGARTTPHMFIINPEGVLVYAGAIDNDRRKLGDVNFVDKALEEVLAGKEVSQATSKPYGCSVKYSN
ncbi:MAG: thioredoxin family protein [Planctomycetes bacterium]|nr:thioredoxin family protein [Planctomycetota bacterium]